MIDRRTFIAAVPAAAATRSAVATAGLASGSRSPERFPRGFIWGAATAGHQIEGNDASSDYWLLENVKPTVFAEPVGDADASFALWPVDLDLVRSLGLTAYRFSLEWSRIEPEPGAFSQAMLDHYGRMIAGCRSRGILPIVTFSHFTVPAWFAARGGWTAKDSSDLFARFCDRAARALSAEIGYAVTLNEPNGTLIGHDLTPPAAWAPERAMLEAAARRCGSETFVGGSPISLAPAMLPNLLAAHAKGRRAIKAARSDLPVGASLAVIDLEAAGEGSLRDVKRRTFYGDWLEATRNDDFVGVQNYSRMLLDAKGIVPVPSDAPKSGEGWEIYPASLANAVEYVHGATGRPILVTEHGLNTSDDGLRAAFIPAALRELRRAMAAGTPVLGYVHWSLLDNFEWNFGYEPRYGLFSVDRSTFARRPKASAAVLARIAHANAV